MVAEGPTARCERVARLEAVLLLAQEPLSSRKLADLASLADGTEARTLVRELNRLYDREGCAFRAVEVAGGFRLVSRQKFVPWLRRLHTAPVEVRLSAPAMETLAVVAYRQPVLRADVEAVRGVHCGEILRQLMERELVRIVGRSEELGRPFLYGTTKQFLEVFGLRHLEDLPRPRLTRTTTADEPHDGLSAPVEKGADGETSSRPIHFSQTQGESNVTSALDTTIVPEQGLEEHAPAVIEEEVPSLTCDVGPEHDDSDDEDYDEDYEDDEDFEDDEDEDFEEEEDEDLEEDEWEEVGDDDEEEDEDEDWDEEDEDWDEEDWDDEDEDEEDEDDWEDEEDDWEDEEDDWDDEEDEDDD